MPVTRTPLVGRQSELEKLGRALDAGAAGDPTFVLLLGEAGIGKTAVLRAASWLAEARGMRVLAGTAIATGAAIPYLPLVAPLGVALATYGDDDPAARAVRQLLGGGTGAADDRQRPAAAHLIESIYEVIRAEPTLVVVDDVHWADGATLTVLDYLAHRSEGDRLAVIAAARNDEPRQLESLPIADGRRYLHLRLDRLGRASVQEQVSMLTGHTATERDLDEVYARSAGVPLFVEELISGATEASDGGLDQPPTSLRTLLRSRITRLSAEARSASDALAVIGQPSAPDLVGTVAGLTPDAAAVALAAAEYGGVAVRRPAGHSLRHPLFGEALLAELDGTPHGQVLHRRAAEALTAMGAAAAETARHWEAAGDSSRAWTDSLAAGRQAQAGSAFGEARVHFERASALWPAGVEGRGTTLLQAARSAWLNGDADDAVALAREAIADGDDGPESLVELGSYLWDAGYRAESNACFAAVASSLPERSAPAVRARVLWGLGRARIGDGAFAEAHRLGLHAARLAARAGNAAIGSQALVMAGMARMWADDIGGTDDLQRGLSVARSSGDPSAIGHAFQFLADTLVLAGRDDDARAIGEEGVATCDRIGLARSHGSDVRAALGTLLIERGEWAAADDVLDRAEPRSGATFARALLALRRGEREAWERDAAAAETELSIGGRGRLDGNRELAHAELAWLDGRTQDGLQQLDAIGWLPGVWAADVAARTALWRARLGMPAQGPVRPPNPLLAAAVEAEITARERGSESVWQLAVEAWAAADRPYERAIALISAAGDANQRGERPEGRHWLAAGSRLAAELGARPLVERAEALARRARIRLDGAGVTVSHAADASSLTPREGEVLALLAEGRTNPQIAQELFISPKTAGIHVQRVLEKLDAHTRGEAVAVARRRGLLA